MKVKQIALTVAISAASAVASVWGYQKFTQSPADHLGNSGTNLPANYAGFFDGKANPAETVDLTKAANTAVPAVVHIRTKIPARKQTNNVPSRRNGACSTIFSTTCLATDLTLFPSKEHRAAVC